MVYLLKSLFTCKYQWNFSTLMIWSPHVIKLLILVTARILDSVTKLLIYIQFVDKEEKCVQVMCLKNLPFARLIALSQTFLTF